MTSEKEYEYRGKLKDVADVTERIFLTDSQVLSHQYGTRGALRI